MASAPSFLVKVGRRTKLRGGSLFAFSEGPSYASNWAEPSRAGPSGPVNDQILNVGLMLAMEFGENWLKPIQSRLGSQFPELPPSELDRYDITCRAAMKFGHAQFDDAVRVDSTGGAAAKDAFARLVRERYSWVDDEAMGRLWSQACYYVWREGWTGGSAS